MTVSKKATAAVEGRALEPKKTTNVFGRPRLDPEGFKRISISMAPRHSDKFHELGGSRWLRKVVDQADIHDNRVQNEIEAQKMAHEMDRARLGRDARTSVMGRPRLDPEGFKRISATLAPSQAKKFRTLGGSRWLRFVIDEADPEKDSIRK